MKLIRLLTLAIVFLFSSLSSYAVLKGDDVNETVIMLSSELEVFSKHVDATINDFLIARDIYKDKIHEFRKEMVSAKLSLYSQQEQYIFGNAYASENAYNLCQDFHKNKQPIDSWKISYNRSLSRCAKLHETLSKINPNSLNYQAKKSRAEGIKCLNGIISDLKNWKDSIDVDIKRFNVVATEVDSLQSEVDKNYKYILNSLLLLPDKKPTHVVFGAEFPTHWNSCIKTLSNMTTTSNYYGWEFQDKWANKAYFIIFAGIIAFVIGILLGELVYR